jgi:DNA-binding NarL/FixJ family response regulator
MTIKIVIVDDHPLMLTALEDTLTSDPEIEVIGTAANSKVLFKILDQQVPNLLVLDMGLPGIHGADLIRIIKSTYKELEIMIYSASPAPEDISDALQAGAIGYLTKDAHKTENIQKKREDRSPANLLTKREFQIAQCIVDGKTNHEISKQFNLSETTVRVHINNIVKKLDMQKRSELVHFILTHRSLFE